MLPAQHVALMEPSWGHGEGWEQGTRTPGKEADVLVVAPATEEPGFALSSPL